MIDMILVGLVSIGVFSLFVFVAVREGAINKKLKMYERSIDILNKEIVGLRKELKTGGIAQLDLASLDGKFSTQQEFDEFTNIIVSKLQDIQRDYYYFKTSVNEKIEDMESKENLSNVVMASSAPMPTSSADEQKIISLFESGFTLEDISKQLRINVGEVEFVLKLNNVRTRSLFN